MRLLSYCAAALLFSLANAAAGAGDAERGARVFGQCMVCHSMQSGEHLTGPSLAHVFNRKAGSAEGFQRYSDALKRSGVTWDEAALDAWLANPERFLPGNSMTFPGLKQSADRRDAIAYLNAVAECKAPPAERGRGGMMMRSGKVDLKKAPPAGRVTSIGYCGDTYTVRTADGKSNKVWEFNLRFKTDSSNDGPLPGAPVMVGAGMQGDRASIIFAAPDEISRFIDPSCP